MKNSSWLNKISYIARKIAVKIAERKEKKGAKSVVPWDAASDAKERGTDEKKCKVKGANTSVEQKKIEKSCIKSQCSA